MARRHGPGLGGHDGAGLEALHRNIVESVASGIVTTDAQGRITYLNPAFAELSATPFENLVGRPLAERLSGAV